MSALRAILLAAAALGFASSAQASIVLDQDALYIPQSPTPGVSLTNLVTVAGNRTVPPPQVSYTDRRFVQTVTAGVSGTLSSVNMQFLPGLGALGGTSGAVQLSLIDGDFAAGARNILASIILPVTAFSAIINPSGIFSVDTSALGYHVAPGQRFSIMGQMLTAEPNAIIFARLGQVQFDPLHPQVPPTAYFSTNYAGGSYYNIFGYPSGNFGATPYDIGFQTFVETAAAVPEPASWALMITGFAMVGGAMRRRSNKRTVLA